MCHKSLPTYLPSLHSTDDMNDSLISSYRAQVQEHNESRPAYSSLHAVQDREVDDNLDCLTFQFGQAFFSFERLGRQAQPDGK